MIIDKRAMCQPARCLQTQAIFAFHYRSAFPGMLPVCVRFCLDTDIGPLPRWLFLSTRLALQKGSQPPVTLG